MAVIVDGHNLLHSIHKEDRDSDSCGDVWLCRILGRYFGQINEKGEIVFDGTGPRDKSEFDNISNLEVFFAGISCDADTVIEDMIAANTAPKRLTVVSSDRRIRDAARKRRATAVKSQVFWKIVQKQLSRKKKVKEPPAKRQGISEGETEQWLDFFGFD